MRSPGYVLGVSAAAVSAQADAQLGGALPVTQNEAHKVRADGTGLALPSQRGILMHKVVPCARVLIKATPVVRGRRILGPSPCLWLRPWTGQTYTPELWVQRR